MAVHRRVAFKVLVGVPAIGLTVYSVLCACAPALVQPSPIPMADGKRNELGIGGSGGVIVDTTCAPDPCITPHGAGQLWYYRQLSRRFGMGIGAFGGSYSYVGGSIAARFTLDESDDFAAYLQADANWIGGGVGVPVAARLGGPVWFYSAPSFGYRKHAINVPFGLSVQATDTVAMNFELAAAYDFGWTESYFSPLEVGPLFHGGADVTFRF